MCRAQLPGWQEFYTRHQNDNFEVVTVAVDAQGAEKARPFVEQAGATYTTLVDETNLLSQMFGFKAVPNGLLIDEQGVLQYRKFGGFDIRKQEYADLLEEWTANPSPEWLAERMQEDPLGGPDHDAAIVHFQQGLEHYHAGNVQDALVEWKKGRDLEQDNWVIRKQIWAVEHPEKFYNGDIDSAWQQEQVQEGV